MSRPAGKQVAPPPLQAVTANRLADGAVVFLTAASGWSVRLADAALADTPDAAAALLAAGEAAQAASVVVGPYLFAVRRDGVGIAAISLRERIRAEGPTTAAGRTLPPASV